MSDTKTVTCSNCHSVFPDDGTQIYRYVNGTLFMGHLCDKCPVGEIDLSLCSGAEVLEPKPYVGHDKTLSKRIDDLEAIVAEQAELISILKRTVNKDE